MPIRITTGKGKTVPKKSEKKKAQQEPQESSDTDTEVANPAVQKGRKGFVPGKSGNPRGRPTGSRNRATLMVPSLIDGRAEEIIETLLELALAGDLLAIKLVLERLIPPMKTRLVTFDLPPTRNAAELLDAYDAVMQAVAQGELTPDEGRACAELLAGKRKLLEEEVEDRLSTLEERLMELEDRTGTRR
jgi:hypothetical protein